MSQAEGKDGPVVPVNERGDSEKLNTSKFYQDISTHLTTQESHVLGHVILSPPSTLTLQRMGPPHSTPSPVPSRLRVTRVCHCPRPPHWRCWRHLKCMQDNGPHKPNATWSSLPGHIRQIDSQRNPAIYPGGAGRAVRGEAISSTATTTSSPPSLHPITLLRRLPPLLSLQRVMTALRLQIMHELF